MLRFVNPHPGLRGATPPSRRGFEFSLGSDKEPPLARLPQAQVADAEYDPFTPERIFALLRDMVVRGSAVRPRQTDPAVANLAAALRLVRMRAQGAIETFDRERDRFDRIAHAMQTLAEVLPIQLDYFAKVERRLGGGYSMHSGALIKASTAPIQSVAKARNVGIPRALDTSFFRVPMLRRW